MANNPGVGSNVISTPKGGGAVSGMGEKFSPDLFTGTGNFSIPIALPPGRNGFQPDITLVYSTGNGNGVFGLGWNLSLPGVARKTSKGIPVYDNTKDVFILSGAEDLVPVPGAPAGAQRYRPRTEGLFARIDHFKDTANDYWKVWSKDGLISYYGTPASANTQVKNNDDAVCADPAYKTKVFQWLLSKTTDVFGNVIEYKYIRESQPQTLSAQETGRNWDNLYISEIKYADYKAGSETKFLASVKFIYEERPDSFSGYKSGFEIRTTKRCTRIEVYTHPAGSEVLAKTYHFVYVDQRVASGELSKEYLPLNLSSLLSQVKIQGHDGEESEWMPPLEFSYTKYEPLSQDFFPVKGRELPNFGLSAGDFEMVDLFGNGLPDIVQLGSTSSGGVPVARYWRNLGNGEYDIPRDMKEAPSGFGLADPEVAFMDADGDGKIDLIVNKPGIAGYFPLQHNGLWNRKSFHSYKYVPSFSLNDPEVKLIDLDGDGVTDVLRNGERLECFFNDPDVGFYKTVTVEKKKLKNFPNVSFADPRIFTQDMSGDGMQDIVMVTSGRVDYWPNMGHGNWGALVTMRNSPRLPYNYDPQRLLFSDVDGDGLCDMIYVENNSVTLWINQSGNSWSDPLVVKGTPPVFNRGSIRIADLLGTGVAGVLWTYDYNGLQRDRMLYLDFTGGVKPYLLHEMNNHMGAITRVQYASSVKYYVADQKEPVRRWKTTLPFPVLVVDKVEVIDEISGSKLATNYSYHHGYWDGGEREFRGFGKVEQLDTETFERYNSSSLHTQRTGLPGFPALPEGTSPSGFNKVEQIHYTPPMLSVSWFHLGPVGDEFGDWHEVSYEEEYWSEDKQVLKRPAEMLAKISALPRRAKRDAYRTLRGSILRTELYALDGTAVQNRPYTVSENLQGMRLEYVNQSIANPASVFSVVRSVSLRTDPDANNKAGSGYIFFSHGLASRTTQWERGMDPLTQFSFTDDYDAYGIPRKQVGIAVPRGEKNLSKGPGGIGAYLVTYGESNFVHKDDNLHYLIGRAISSRSYEIINDGSMSVFQLKQDIFAHAPATGTTPGGGDSFTYKLLSHSVTYYDGTAFTGLAYGELGDYGVSVRTETLLMTDAQVEDCYGDSRPPYLTTGTAPDWTDEYPDQFIASLPENAGYTYHAGSTVYEDGYYCIAERKKFDFHESPSTAKGLVLQMKDPLGNTASVEYDTYKMLPVKVTDPADMETIAQYDYRVMQASEIKDPNLNRVQFAFSPLGFLFKSAIVGKATETVGDTLDDPGTRMEYDFFAWMNNKQPVFVKTTVRQHHIHDDVNDDTIVSIQYSDGFGRLIQSRAQCEEVIFGDSVFGDSGLPLSQTSSASAAGIENTDEDNLNVIVSGWQVYNNKGAVVEKYEPYYDRGFEYSSPSSGVALDALQRSKKVQLFYDPRGHVIKTKNPDGTEQRVVFGIPLSLSNPLVYTPTPWESYTYDANDLRDLTHYGDTTVPSSHINTPASSVMDALGRTVKTTDRLTASSNESEQVVMQYEFDIRGNVLSVTDALGRTTFQHKYDLANRPLSTTHLDAGLKTVVLDCMSKPIEARDVKGALVLNSYDVLNRPVRVWARDNDDESVTLRQRTIYGDDAGLTTPEADNLKGKPFKVYDEAGLTQIDAYDFKGNVPEKKRRVIKDSEILGVFPSASPWDVSAYRVDWDPDDDGNSTQSLPDLETALLDTVEFTTSMTYDALGRIKKMVYPQDVNSERKILLPEYNKAGALTRVKVKDTDLSSEVIYVERIAYNAKGQRILVAFSDHDNPEIQGIMTRYRYDENNFRLTRMKTERFTKSGLTYTPESGTVKQNLAYTYDLSGNIISINDQTSGCGVAGANSLTREFDYDPLYRLLSATGREKSASLHPPFYEAYSPENYTLTRAYSQNYSYDKLGNIQSLQHIATGGNFTRNFDYASGKNFLETIEVGSSTYSFEHDVNGNITSDDGGVSRKYEYDYADRIRSFRIQSSGSEASQYAHYLYDGGGNRVKKIVRKQGGGYKITVYIDGIFEYTKTSSFADKIDQNPKIQIGRWMIGGNSNGEQNILHIMDDQSRIAIRRVGDSLGDITPDIKYNIEDHLGSSSLQLSKNGTLVNREEYYPFGETSFGSYGKKRYRFCGKEKDEESGLYYYGMRYYSAWTCRFMSVDPLASKYPFYTPYQYSGNKPINFIDVDGAEDNNTSTGQNGTNPNNQQAYPVQDNLNVRTSEYGNPVTSKFNLSLNKNGAIPDIAMQTGAFSFFPKIDKLPQQGTSTYTVTKENLKAIFPEASDKVLDKVVPIFNKFLSDYGINSDERFALFLSQVGHESQGFQKTSVTESTYYKTESRIKEIFPKYFKASTGRDAGDYVKNSEKLANVVYSNRMGNGSESSGEGYKFRGRGLMQLTGKDNYQAFTDFYNDKYKASENFVSNPDKIADSVELSILSALWYFKTRVIEAKSYKLDGVKYDFNIDKEDLKGVTVLVNGGLTGYDPERKDILSKAKKVLGL